jgi:hypothetical protein
MTLNKQKVIEWLEERNGKMGDWTQSFSRTLKEIRSGRFDSEPSELQAENQRLREAVEKIDKICRDLSIGTDHIVIFVHDIAIEALSTKGTAT